MKNIINTTFLLAIISITGFGCLDKKSANLSPTEARSIAKEAYIYGYPIVEGYRISYTYHVDK